MRRSTLKKGLNTVPHLISVFFYPINIMREFELFCILNFLLTKLPIASTFHKMRCRRSVDDLCLFRRAGIVFFEVVESWLLGII